MKAKNLTPTDEKAILDNITEGYPVKLTQTGNVIRTVSMNRINGEDNYRYEVAGITINFDEPERFIACLRRSKYTNIKY